MEKVGITTPGIKKALARYDYTDAIAEYIWNGFDAKATCVEIELQYNDLGYISILKVIDNGYGIPKDKLSTKFIPFFESEKELEPK